jgi:hypothetical protein
MQQRTFDLFEIIKIRDKTIQLCDIEYCNILVNEVYKLFYPDRIIEEVPLIEEYDDKFNNDYIHYVIRKINQELTTNGISFIELANSSGEDKTIIHQFILFNTISGVIRLESYGKDTTYYLLDGIAKREPGYVLYKSRIIEWPTWKQDLSMLLSLEPGNCRLCYWNGLFSSKEDNDTNEHIDVVLLV